MKKFFRITGKMIVGLLAFLLLLWILLQMPFFQTWLTQHAASMISKRIGAKVTVKHVTIGWLNKVNMEGVFVEDQHKDTLLSAGLLQVNITDWFIFEKDIELEYVKLKDVTARLHRKTDSIWNYQFILDHFASEEKKSGGSNINLRLNEAELENIHFMELDEWRGKSTLAGVGKLRMNAREIDFKKQIFNIRNLQVDAPYFKEIRRRGQWRRTDSIGYRKMRDAEIAADTLPPEINAGKMNLTVEHMDVKDGFLQFYNRRRRPSKPGEFDERDIIISKLSGQINALKFVNDTLNAKVDLSANERSGIVLKRIKTDLVMNSQMMEFENLDLQLNDSRLGDYYAMHYNGLEDMEDFLQKVTIEARLQNSILHMKDIGFFAPLLKTKNQVVDITGHAIGSVSNFIVKGLSLKTGSTHLVGNFSMEGLVDIENTLIKFETPGSRMALQDVAVWAPQLLDLKKSPVGNLGMVIYQGNFLGTVYDFKAKGKLITDVGRTDADFTLAMSGPKKGYKGILTNADFDGGKLLNVAELGRIQFNGVVSSNGFGSQNPIQLHGEISRGNYAGYEYQDIKVDGEFGDNKLTADIALNDRNLAGQFETVLDFNTKKQRYNGKGVVSIANLQALGIVKDSLLFSGAFDLDFNGTTIDDFLGYARFYDARILRGSIPLSFDSLLVQSSIDSAGFKKLSLHTNEADVSVIGKFNLSNLPNSFQFFLSRYYPSIINAPKKLVKDQDFQFNVETRQIEPFLAIFNSKLKGFEFAKLAGSLNTNSNELLLNADVPSMVYNNIRLTNISLKGAGDGEQLNVLGSTDNIQMNDSLNMSNIGIRLTTNKDTTHVLLNTSTQGPLGEARLDAYVFSLADGFELRWNESSFFLNNKKWTINEAGSLAMRNGYLFSDGITLQQDSQQIKLSTQPSGEGNWNDVHVSVQNLNTSDILPYFISEPRLEGNATGNFVVADILGSPQIQGKLRIDQFRFNNDSVGVVDLTANYNTRTQKMVAEINSPNKDYDFSGVMQLDLNDSAREQINIDMPLKNMRINVLQKYLGIVFDQIDGFATGNLRLVGKLKSPAILGAVRLRDAKMKVGYTKVVYTIDSANLKFGDNFIDLGVIKIKDEKKRPGQVEGRFYHRFFDSLFFNLKMKSDGMSILNTTALDNDLFYGNAVASATFDLNGPLSNLRMRITGTPTDSSHISISNKTSRESGVADFIVFKSYGTEMVGPKSKDETNMHIDMDLNANPLCKIDVILDELTGDVIKATGTGNLKIRTGTYEPTYMRGRYNIERGSYNYNFQALIRKPFDLVPGDDNFIEWTGDLLNANLNVKARYLARKVSMSTLVGSNGSNTTLDQNARNASGDVIVVANIVGNMSKPDIDFDIEFAPGSSLSSNLSARELLRRIREDKSEKLRQVTYLIVFKSFAPYKTSSSTNNPGTDLAVNTITDIVSREMGKILSNLVHEITGDHSLSVDISTNFYNSASLVNGTATNTAQYDRVNLNFNLNRSYFNNRVVFNLGSDFDLSVRNTTANGFQFLPDISVEFILTSNRRLRAILFKRDNLDIGGRRNRAGASFSYRKDYEHFFGANKDEALIFIKRNKTAKEL